MERHGTGRANRPKKRIDWPCALEYPAARRDFPVWFLLQHLQVKAAAVYVETHSLTKQYGPFTALAGCTLSIAQGEVFGLLGPNGAGKTTLLRLLLGFLRPSAGQARIDGLDCYRQAVAVHRTHGLSAGRGAFVPPDERPRRATVFRRDARPARSGAGLLKSPNGWDWNSSRPVSAMSTGMRQKLALAATLAADTPLVILDEPTSNLDPTVRGDVIELVAEAKQRRPHRDLFFPRALRGRAGLRPRGDPARRRTSPHPGHEPAPPATSHSRAANRSDDAAAHASQRADQRRDDCRRRVDHRNAWRTFAAVGLVGHVALGGGTDRASRLARRVRSLSRRERVMNRALWKKNIREARWLLAGCTAVDVRLPVAQGLAG